MRRSLLTGAAIAAALAAGLGAGRAMGTDPVHAAVRAHHVTISGDCPKRALPLPGEAVARAADQARIEAPAIYGDLGVGARVVAAEVARGGGDDVRSEQVLKHCGKRIAARTVVVELFMPRGLPSASLSQGTVFVSREAAGYAVWEVAH
jgi:hypothetical protein